MSDFRVRCVKVFGHQETQKLIEEAFECLKQQKLSPVWFSEDECFAVKEKKKNEVYIFDVFSGEAFEHITSLGARVLGPMCVITSLACKKDIPKRQKPIYNLAMKDLVVCCTNIDKSVRNTIHEKVEWMGGNVTRDLTEHVTHLVAGSVGSPKYWVAGSMNKQIMLPKWVEEVWEMSKLEAAHGGDEKFQDYKCPIFYGHVITVSGLSSSERTEAKRLIEKEGGVYSGEMKAKECTHLIINEPKGQKYNFALRWMVNVVRSEWLYESIEAGYCQDEKKFPVEQSDNAGGQMKTSTPERRSMAAGDITDINNISMISMANVNETAVTNVTNFTRMDDPTENLDLTKAPEDLFLDGCKIYLSGFRGAALEKLRKIINSGGGSRFNQISDNLTHVVTGEKVGNDLNLIKALTNRPHMVTSQWLVDCFKQEKHLEETQYYSSEVVRPAPKTPEAKSVRKKSQVQNDEPKPSTSDEGGGPDDDDMHDIMSQYLDNPQQNKTDESRSNETTVAPMEGDNDLTQDPDSTPAATGCDTVKVTEVNDASTSNDVNRLKDDKKKTKSMKKDGAIFAKKSFVFYGFNEDGISVLSSYIKENGGTVLQGNARKIPDYAIVPIDGFPVDRTVKDITTNAWLQTCIEQNELMDIHENPLFTPIELSVDALPLQGCVLSVSGYQGTERECLVSIADVLGAKTQDHFVRHAKNGLLPSTHLVVNAPEGSKYMAAKKWGTPAVSKLWILACAKTGKKEKEESFLIDNSPNDNINIDALVEKTEKQPGNISVNQAKVDNQSRKPFSNNQRDSNDIGIETGANDQTRAPIEVDEQTKENESRRNETSFRDFSTMGDTEAILAGLNTQGEQNTVCDKDKTLSTSDDEVIIRYPNVKDAAGKAGDNIGAGEGIVETDQDKVQQNRDKEDEVDDDDDEVIIVNKNVQKEVKKPETPALTRFMKKLEKDAPKAGTPVLTDKSLRQRLLGKGAQGWRTTERKRREEEQASEVPAGVRQEIEAVYVETPPLTRFMRKLEKDPPKPGTPLLTETSAREKLLGKGFQGPRTIERKKKQQEESQSQKENMQTPVQSRLKELKDDAGGAADKVTPSKFLNPNVRYFPKFHTEELLKALETPEDERATRARKRKQSMDDEELFDWAVNKATKNLADLREARLQGNLPASQSTSDEHDGEYEEPSTALRGVVITVGKKLTKDQDELHTLVSSLGGDYRWTFDKSSTHFIFQGRQNDTSKEFKQAKASGMKIVSPHWLYICKEQNARVEESLFPHTFNPNLSLSVVSTKRTPLRTPRSSRRTARAASKTDIPRPSEPIVITTEDDVKTMKGSKTVSPVASKGAAEENLKSPERGSSDEDKKATEMEAGGSLEMREVLSKQLEDVMSKGKKRRKSKKLNSSGQVGTPEESLSSSSKQGRRTQENVHRNSSSRSLRGMADEEAEEKNSAEVAPSQPVHVSWDDPMSRLEQAKLAHKLERANSPTQEVGGMYDLDPDDAQYSESEGDEVPVPPFGEQQQIQERTTPKYTVGIAKKTPTPEGPSIAFPTSKKSSEVTPPKPIEMEDDQLHEETAHKPPPVFIMSGMSTAERDNYGALVEQLGGKVLDTQTYDNSCTHLVINNVTRNEKFLASLASGKWVLHKSFFEACRQEQRFVEEDFYEWGSEGTLSLVKNMESNVRMLAIAARDWRIKIQQEKLRSPSSYGAFCAWRVLLNCDRSRECNYRRLLIAGGATVLNLKPPYPSKIDATHALLELHKVPLPQEDMEKLISSDCLCLKPEYISGYLCNPNADVTDYTPPEIVALQTVMFETTENTGKKRKASSSNITPKRSKRR